MSDYNAAPAKPKTKTKQKTAHGLSSAASALRQKSLAEHVTCICIS